MDMDKAKEVSDLYNRKRDIEVLAWDIDTSYRALYANAGAEKTVKIPVRWLPVLVAKAHEEMANIEKRILAL